MLDGWRMEMRRESQCGSPRTPCLNWCGDGGGVNEDEGEREARSVAQGQHEESTKLPGSPLGGPSVALMLRIHIR